MGSNGLESIRVGLKLVELGCLVWYVYVKESHVPKHGEAVDNPVTFSWVL
jgi:hypothetical protein